MMTKQRRRFSVGRVVSQNELLKAFWPDTFVQPEVLKTHILDVRSTLGDSAINSRFTETLPRRTYCFIAQVSDPAAGVQLSGRGDEVIDLAKTNRMR